VARRLYEEMLKNLIRRSKAVGCDPDMVEPGFQELFNRFVRQNVEAEGWLRRAERIREYERGRADMQAAIALGLVPRGMGSGPGCPPQVHARGSNDFASFPPPMPGPATNVHAPAGTGPSEVKPPRVQ